MTKFDPLSFIFWRSHIQLWMRFNNILIMTPFQCESFSIIAQALSKWAFHPHQQRLLWTWPIISLIFMCNLDRFPKQKFCAMLKSLVEFRWLTLLQIIPFFTFVDLYSIIRLLFITGTKKTLIGEIFESLYNVWKVWKS